MMKKIGLVALVLLLIGAVFTIDSLDLTGSKVSAETATEMHIVSVSGVGTILVKPDLAYIQIGVQTRDVDAAVAQEANKVNMNAVIDALKKMGIKEGDIQTTNYNIYRTYDYAKPVMEGQEPPMYYQVDNTVKVTVRSIDTVGDTIDVAFGAGANTINSITFDVSNRDELYQKALELAMKSAKDKANAIMKTFGESADKPHKVYEAMYSSGPYVNTMYAMDAVKEASSPIESGELAISANLTVEYTY